MTESKSARNRDRRRQDILRAVLKLLRKHGTGITTAQIAAEASCSKETLYNWFGDRDGIMQALAEAQAEGMGAALERAWARADRASSFAERLEAYSITLLDILTGEAVTTVNRLAMADACREQAQLGLIVLDDWHSKVVSPFVDLLESGASEGVVTFDDPEDAFQSLFGLLIGDRQRRLLLGEDARPGADAMQAIAAASLQKWFRLYGVADRT